MSIGIFLFCFAKIKANHPPPDYLIIGNDTSYIYMRPLDKLDSVTQKLYYQNLKRYFTLNAYPVSIWGYYPAYWQLIDNKLFLVGIKGVSNVDSILQATFPKHYDNGKVFAYWFSSFLTIPKGKILKKDVYSYTRTYFREELFKFENGKLHSRKIIRNYIDLKNGITRLNYEIISDSIFNRIKRLNWKILSDSGCDCTYSININEAGKIGTITYWKSTPE
ncbi:MAG TPA: hypothetical protein VK484_15185, partial [Ferruginibacter sp.]|nr:hypothetical protein [Ferruginibacter sp.]